MHCTHSDFWLAIRMKGIIFFGSIAVILGNYLSLLWSFNILKKSQKILSLLQTITSFLTNKLLLHQNLKIFLANKDCSISINSKKYVYHLALAWGDVFATIDINLFNPDDDVQSNRLALFSWWCCWDICWLVLVKNTTYFLISFFFKNVVKTHTLWHSLYWWKNLFIFLKIPSLILSLILFCWNIWWRVLVKNTTFS